MLRRVVGRDGRSRAFVNDQPVGVALLRRAGALLVEVQGQHEQMGLADPASHAGLLDAFGVPAPLREAVRAAWRHWRESAGGAGRGARGDRGGRARRGLAAPRRRRTGQAGAAGGGGGAAGRRAPAAAAGRAAGRGDRRGAGGARPARPAQRRAGRGAARGVPGVAAADRAGAADGGQSGRAGDGRAGAGRGGAGRGGNLADPAGRRGGRRSAPAGAGGGAAVRAARRGPQARAWRWRNCRRCWTRWRRGWPRWRPAPPRWWRWNRRRATPGRAMSRRRRRCRRRGGRRRCGWTARWRRNCRRCGWTRRGSTPRWRRWRRPTGAPAGRDAVRFLIATNPGQELGPLGRIASGGELSRLMLALKVVLSAGSPVPTLVFDEVDSDVGGATAAAVGERLARVAAGVQVLVVTHSPQVAARGAAHLRVAKQAARGRTATRVDVLDGRGAARGDRAHAGRRDGHRGGAGGGRRSAGGRRREGPTVIARSEATKRSARARSGFLLLARREID